MVAVAAVVAVRVVLIVVGSGAHGKRVAVMVMSCMMVVMVMRMHAYRIRADVPMKSERRRPGELERDDEHDDQGDEAAHGHILGGLHRVGIFSVHV